MIKGTRYYGSCLKKTALICNIFLYDCRLRRVQTGCFPYNVFVLFVSWCMIPSEIHQVSFLPRLYKIIFISFDILCIQDLKFYLNS